MAKVSKLLFDSSAITKLYCYENGSNIVDYWLKEHNKNKRREETLIFYLPNICVVEIMKAICDKYQEKVGLKDVSYLNMIATFLKDLETSKYYSICNISMSYLVYTKDVIEHMYNEFKEDILSPIDALILAKAYHMKQKDSNLYVAADDRNLQLVGVKLGLNIINPRDIKTIPQALRPPQFLK